MLTDEELMALTERKRRAMPPPAASVASLADCLQARPGELSGSVRSVPPLRPPVPPTPEAQERAAKRAREREAERAAELKSLSDWAGPMASVGLPARYSYVLTDYPAIQERVQGWLADPRSWCLYLYGPTRSRKTSIACAVLRAIRQSRVDAWVARRTEEAGLESWERRNLAPPEMGAFVGPYDLAATIRDAANEASRARYDGWGTVPLLLLDDMGKYKDTPYLVEQTLLLLHRRYDLHDGQTRTIITANMGLDELAARIDPATACRVAEGLCIELAASAAGAGAGGKENLV